MTVPCLDAEQRIAWAGALPTDLASLPDLMERLHFAVVERVTRGNVHARRTEAGVSLELLGRWPVLVFDRLGDEVSAGRALRRYRMPPGPLTRRAPGEATFELGAAESGGQTHAWVRLTHFPALFLSCPPPAPAIYAAFHARVSHAYLRVLRSQLSLIRSGRRL